MKRRFHCKKVEEWKCKVIVIPSEAKNLIGPADAAGLENQRCFASLNMTG